MKNFLEKVTDIFKSSSYPRTLTLLGILIVAIAIPVTVTILQQRTQTQQHASGNNTYYCVPRAETCDSGDTFTYNSSCTPSCTTQEKCCMHAGAISCAVGSKPFCGVNHTTCIYRTYLSNGLCASTIENCKQVTGSCGYNPNGPFACVIDGEAAPNNTYYNINSPTVPAAYNHNGVSDQGTSVGNHPIAGRCANNQVCSNKYTSPGGYPCININMNSCSCDANDAQHKNFTCSDAFGYYFNRIHRTCGNGLVCQKGAHQGQEGWPCASASTNPTFACFPNTQGQPAPNNQYHDLKNPTSTAGACANNQICDSSFTSPGGYPCINIDVNSCKCNGTNNNKGFTCSDAIGRNTAIRKSCGYGMICKNGAHQGADGWPCAPDYSQCKDFIYTGPATINSSTECQNIAQSNELDATGGINLSNCPYPDLYTLQSVASQKCVFKAPLSTTSSQDYSCTDGKETGICFSNNSCGASRHELVNLKAPTCSQKGKRICCAPNGNQGSTGQNTGTSTGNDGGSSCTNGQSTAFSLTINLPGIGDGQFDNHTPKRVSRSGSVDVSGKAKKHIHAKNHVFSKSGSGFGIDSAVDLGKGLACGDTYTLTVTIPQYLPATTTVTYGNTTQTLQVTPIPGDINIDSTGQVVGDGKIDIQDYNLMKSCRNVDPSADQTTNSNGTTVHYLCGNVINLFDYPDGGTQGDEWSFNYNLWLRGFIQTNRTN